MKYLIIILLFVMTATVNAMHIRDDELRKNITHEDMLPLLELAEDPMSWPRPMHDGRKDFRVRVNDNRGIEKKSCDLSSYCEVDYGYGVVTNAIWWSYNHRLLGIPQYKCYTRNQQESCDLITLYEEELAIRLAEDELAAELQAMDE